LDVIVWILLIPIAMVVGCWIGILLQICAALAYALLYQAPAALLGWLWRSTGGWVWHRFRMQETRIGAWIGSHKFPPDW
jgi:hypothetical protein